MKTEKYNSKGFTSGEIDKIKCKYGSFTCGLRQKIGFSVECNEKNCNDMNWLGNVARIASEGARATKRERHRILNILGYLKDGKMDMYCLALDDAIKAIKEQGEK